MIFALTATGSGKGEKPPGAQIKRWYIILILLVFLVNVSAIASLLMFSKALNDIVNHHEPLLQSAETINAGILEAQVNLSRYLSEDERDLTKAYGPLDSAAKSAEQAGLYTKSAALKKDLEEIKTSVAKFKKALGELKAAKSGRNWRQVEEFRRAALDLGSQTQNSAQKMKTETYTQIKAQNDASLLMAKIVFIIILLLFLISIAVVWAVLYWWRRFQDVLLEI